MVTRKVLLVIDMLVDFIEEDGKLFCGTQAREIIPFVQEKVREFLDEGHEVIFVADAHDPNDLEFKRFPVHCVNGTPGAELIKEMKDLWREGQCTVVKKRRYSAFYGTDLERLLHLKDPDEVHVVGVCTNICVLYTVEELCNRDIKTVVYKDGVASFDRNAHLWALEQMKSVLGAEVR